MLRTLSRVSELPIVVRQLQKVRNCNAAVAVTNNKTIVTVTNTKQQQHAKQSNISNIRNNSSNCRQSSSSSNNTNTSGSSSKGGSSQWITRQQQLQQQLRYASRRSYSSSFFGLFQNAAQAGVAKTNNYATEATVQVNRVSSSSSRQHPPKWWAKRKRRLHNVGTVCVRVMSAFNVHVTVSMSVCGCVCVCVLHLYLRIFLWPYYAELHFIQGKLVVRLSVSSKLPAPRSYPDAWPHCQRVTDVGSADGRHALSYQRHSSSSCP